MSRDDLLCLETILDYGMSSQEAAAYKIACIFIELMREAFPTMKPFTCGKGDPRKHYLFKVCYKLVREIQHKISECHYPLYVRAQIDIIRLNATKHGKIPNLSPNCLVGDKAWNRWLVWKRLYDKRIQRRTETAAELGVNVHQYERIISALKRDKVVLETKMKNLTADAINQAANSRSLVRWIATRQISPYYALLSPVLNNWLESRNLTIESTFQIDFDLYRPGITDEIEEFFRHEYHFEYQSAD